MKKLVFIIVLIIFLALNYMLFNSIRGTLRKIFIDEAVAKAKIIEETSNSIFELISNNEQQYISNRYKIAKATDIHSILDKNKRMELMLNYDIEDIALMKRDKYIVYPRSGTYKKLPKITGDTAIIRNSYLFICEKYQDWIKIFVFNMESIDIENDTLNFGAFLRKIKDKTNTIYFIWQDLGGIIAATGNISRISSIDSDVFLMDALKTGDYNYRFIIFGGKRGIEVVKCINKSEKQILRICFDALPLYNGIRKLFLMFLLSSFLIVLVAVGIFILLYSKKAMEEITKENLFNREIIRNVFNGIESPLVIFDKKGQVELKNRLYDRLEPKLKNKNFFRNLEENDTIEIANRLYSVFLSDINVENMVSKYRLAMLIDKTDRINLERIENERKRQKENEEFIAEFAHQVKNPLNAISMATQRLLSCKKFDKELVSIIYDEISLLNRSIGDFLEKIRESGGSKVCVNKVLASICKLYKVEAEGKNILLKCNIPKKCYYLSIKKMDITDIMNNLVKNAIESFDTTKKRARYIKIEMKKDKDFIIITVRDNGKGIDEKTMGKLFNKGYSEKVGGSGLGLYVVKKIVEKYGGTIDLKLTSEGEKMFQISLKFI